MRTSKTLAAAVLALLPSLVLADPGAAVTRARQLIASSNYQEALETLRDAAPEAAAFAGIKDRSAALSAIHFYSSLALSGMNNEDEAAAELRAFFRYQPNSSLEAGQYPARFAALFKKIKSDVAHGTENYKSFDDAYPGSGYQYSRRPTRISIWGSSSEFILLATDEEKSNWGRLQVERDQLEFVADFWGARDPDPSTPENALRDQILSRIAFADLAFGDTADGRGSLSDRGRVFVLLGKPAKLTIRPLNQREALFAPRRRMSATGAVEEWTYFREQIPGKLPAHEVTFRFVNDAGHGQRVLQQEFMPTKARAAAKASLVTQ